MGDVSTTVSANNKNVKTVYESLEDLASGQAEVGYDQELGVSVEKENGYWIKSGVVTRVKLRCHQTQESIDRAFDLAAKIARTKALFYMNEEVKRTKEEKRPT